MSLFHYSTYPCTEEARKHAEEEEIARKEQERILAEEMKRQDNEVQKMCKHYKCATCEIFYYCKFLL